MKEMVLKVSDLGSEAMCKSLSWTVRMHEDSSKMGCSFGLYSYVVRGSEECLTRNGKVEEPDWWSLDSRTVVRPLHFWRSR